MGGLWLNQVKWSHWSVQFISAGRFGSLKNLRTDFNWNLLKYQTKQISSEIFWNETKLLKVEISRFWTLHLEVRPRQPCLLKLTLHPVSWDRLSHPIRAIRGFWQLISMNSMRREIKLQTLVQLGIKDYFFEKTLSWSWLFMNLCACENSWGWKWAKFEYHPFSMQHLRERCICALMNNLPGKWICWILPKLEKSLI